MNRPDQPTSFATKLVADPEELRGLLAELRSALPVEDLLAWVVEQRPQASFDQTMALMKEIYAAGMNIAAAKTTPRTYRVGGRQMRACPQRVEA